ncbi:hypothetical protein E2562_033292 [Oryza meyeriana var. granulata]|uniref:Uncharacterized protein n=1 Tax=Oryza meyeriana var. granulata TaxID=110450 RepID=A0A6G1CWM6_9ORYZ|nr:hypothetical protein E2562_033292 [Oryza meyeriana var. granulata]
MVSVTSRCSCSRTPSDGGDTGRGEASIRSLPAPPSRVHQRGGRDLVEGGTHRGKSQRGGRDVIGEERSIKGNLRRWLGVKPLEARGTDLPYGVWLAARECPTRWTWKLGLDLTHKKQHNKLKLRKKSFILLASLGAVHVAAAVFRLIAFLSFGLHRPKNLRRRYGAWAVVTGPTSGIGRAMALELAAHGLNVVLVGRDPAKLRDVADAIARSHGVRTKTVVFDFSLVSTVQGEKAMAALREAVEGVDVGVLVNNAGVAKPGAMFLHEADMEPLMRMVRVNALALTKVTAAVLPGMAERGRGAVVNIGSASSGALPSFPLYSVYAGTKAYVAAFSRGLSVEYKSKGIDVQCQVPFLIETNMISSFMKGNFVSQFMVTSESYAHAAV